MMKQWTTILIVAATYVGTVVGAGFATGKEIVTFFSVNGIFGTIGIVCSGFLFIFAGTKIMVISARIQAYSYQELNQYLFGRKIGNVINIFIFIIVVGITSVLLSGAGAVFQEQIGLPFQLGIVSTLIISYIVLLKGLKGIFAINAYIVPVMIIFSLFIAVAIYGSYPHVLLDQTIPDGLSRSFSWIASPFTYAAFNLMTAQVVLVPLGKEIKDEHILRAGGFLGGIVLFLILLANHFSMSAFPGSFAYEIPMAEIVKGFGALLHGLFLFVIIGEIFNSVVGNVFGITRQLQSAFKLRYHHAILVILFVIFLVSQVGYGKLLAVLYPLFGYVGLLFLVCIVMKKLPAR
ncbi:YkvI family membrane protein [Virgibacillus flavescens]|uniref:YkvI family membrane protein n=1 Tax=Virgibacillus flavescens TaxID=1611422 RepID=UPI003D3450E7